MAEYAGSSLVPLEQYSLLQRERLSYVSAVPAALADPRRATVLTGEATVAATAAEEATTGAWFPHLYGNPVVTIGRTADSGATDKAAHKAVRVGIVFCGRQTPGVHNVVAGLADHLHALNPASVVVGFEGGTKGLFEGKALEVTQDLLALVRSQGGMNLLGRSADRIRTPTELAATLATCDAQRLDGLVLVGGCLTATDAAHLSEYFAARQTDSAGAVRTRIIAVPATIDGDLRNQFVETTVGHDTATKTYAQLAGNIATDASSAKKYWYFCRLMGRHTGHVALETALLTHPNAVLLAEDIEARKLTLTDIVKELADAVSARKLTLMDTVKELADAVSARKLTLSDIVKELADAVVSRAAAGAHFGVVLVPEGTLAAIPELRTLIAEMNGLFGEGLSAQDAIAARLTPWSAAVLSFLPPAIRAQLFLERESSGAIQLSQVSTEALLAHLVGSELTRRAAAGTYKGKFATVTASLGYQARSALPSNFDCALGATLGRTAAALVLGGCGGYMATARNLTAPPGEWEAAGVPLSAMMSSPRAGSVQAAAYASLPAPASASAAGAAAAAGAGAGHDYKLSAASGGAGAGASSSSSSARGAPAGSRPVIESAPVDVHGPAFAELKRRLPLWLHADSYANPGPIQFDGPTADEATLTLRLAPRRYMARIRELRAALDAVRDACKPGVPESVLDVALTGAQSLAHILSVMRTGSR